MNQMQSSLGSVINMDVAKKTGAHLENPKTSKNVQEQLNSAGNLINWKTEAQLNKQYNSINARFN